MNKRLFVLICSVILFQYTYNSDCSTDETATEKSVCFGKAVDDSTNICILKSPGPGCEEKAKGEVPCEDVESGASDALCISLQTTKLCLKEGNACKEKEKSNTNCEDVKAGATDALCGELKLDNTNDYNCVKDGNACKKKIKECQNGNGSTDAECNKFSTAEGYVCKKDTDPDKTNKCKPVKDESATSATSSSYSLKFSLALLIFLFLF